LSAAPLAGLGLYLIALGLERAHELRVSARNQRALVARGAAEHGRRHFPLLVAIHALLPLALALEVLAGGARPPTWWPAPLALLVLAEALRLWSMAALGGLWTARIFTLPEVPRIRSGPYRWLAHPSYLAATIDLLAAPLMFGAWRTAIGLSALNAVVITIRIRAETRALAAAVG